MPAPRSRATPAEAPAAPAPEPAAAAADGTFVAAQRAFWAELDAAHFAWQTGAPYVAATEALLLDRVEASPGGRLLEIGCGEGANLHHLAALLPGVRLFGIDFTPAKARFAAAHTGCAAAAADATRLPFGAASFDAVLIRDLLHHLPDAGRQRALDEAARVLRPGGSLTLIEPNGRNPLIAATAAVIAAERGMLASTARRAAAEVAGAGLRVESVERRQPMPLSRLLLHYRFGWPRLGARPAVAALLAGFERAARLLPRAVWAYVVVQGRKP